MNYNASTETCPTFFERQLTKGLKGSRTLWIEVGVSQILRQTFFPVTNCLNLDGVCSEFMPHKKCEVGTEYALDINVGNGANLVSCASFCGSMHVLVCAPTMPTSLPANIPLCSALYILYIVLSLKSCYHLNDRSWSCMVVFKKTVTCPEIIFLASSESANRSKQIFCDFQSVLSSPSNSNVPLLL